MPFNNFAQTGLMGKTNDGKNENVPTITDTTSTEDSLSAIKNKNNFIEHQVVYNAEDSIVLSNDAKKVYLYNKAKIVYGDIQLEADYIEYDQEKNFVFARGVEDSLGNLIGKPKFKEKNDEFVARTIKYDFKTKKGYIQDVFTQEEQGYLHSEETKKLEDNSFLLKNGKYTTCDNEEHPHFYLKMSKAKVIPNDKIISGFSYLVLEDVPMPIGIPFGFFPSQSQYSSGIIPPKYGEENNRGFFLRDGGYYFGISDKMDLALTGDIYSKGSWGGDVKFRYKKKYKFSSNFDYSYAVFVTNPDLPTEEKRKDMSIRWTHMQDPKANPNSTFSASVNYSTSSYDQFNSKTLDQRNTNTKSSSISYSKSFPGRPFRFNMNLKHTQNSNTKNIALTLPVMTFNMDRQYPFRKKNSTGETKWYENIEVQYSSQLENRITTKDTLLFNSKYSDDYATGTKWSDYEKGFQHSIPLSTNIKILHYFNLSPQVKYTGILYPDYLKYGYVENVDSLGKSSYELTIDTVSSIRYAQMVEPSVSLSVGPNVYGMYRFKNPNSKVVAIRHVITPSVGVSFRPDLGSMVSGYYFKDSISSREYSIFDDGIYRLPAAPGKSGSINFSLNNNLEMKVRDDEDTTGTGTKKIKLLQSFRISTSYNIFADSLNWDRISIRGRTSLFQNKLNFNFGASVDPYALNTKGTDVINKFQWNTEKGGVGRLTRVDFSVDFKLASKNKKGKGSDNNTNKGFNANNNLNGEFNSNDRFSQYGNPDIDNIQNEIVSYVDFDIPWSLNANYKFLYSKTGFNDSKRVTQTMSISGDISLTKKWKISFRANYDLVKNELSSTSINIHRDLHCWEASFNWIPVGYMQSYNFQINVKGSTLRDFLKYHKRKSWQDNL